MTDKVMAIFLSHLKIKHKLFLYDYQKKIAWAVFDALLQNMRLTLGATEEDIKKLKRTELAVEISRQAGKTTDVVAIIEYVMIFFTQMFHQELHTGIFAPQREQSKTDFDRLKTMLIKDTDFTEVDSSIGNEDLITKAREESNSKTLVLPNGSSCYVFPITPTSKPESKTLHLIVVEEAQDADDKILKEQIWPMGAATNAPIIYIGTAGTRICHFYRLGQTGTAIKLYYHDIVADRRKVYEETSDVQHLIYERNVAELIQQYGQDSDEVQRPYFGKWLIGTGQFTTQEDVDALVSERKRTFHDKKNECYVGIDTAKHPDSTIVTVMRKTPILKCKEAGCERVGKWTTDRCDKHGGGVYSSSKQLLNWMELRGENYKNQFDYIKDFLGNYNVVGIAIDSTGQGDFMPDMFEMDSKWQDEHSGLFRIKFSPSSKDNIYKNLKVSITELLTDLPKLDTREGERFKQQMLDLQQEWKGQLLSVNHPNSDNAHDDYPDSWALAEWAFAKYNENRPTIAVASSETKHDGGMVKDDEGHVTDHWPGADW